MSDERRFHALCVFIGDHKPTTQTARRVIPDPTLLDEGLRAGYVHLLPDEQRLALTHKGKELLRSTCYR